MPIYRALRPALFALDAERAHALTLGTLRALGPFTSTLPASTTRGGPVRLMGLEFANRVGIAAGFDKNGTGVRALGLLGCGHIEVGTVTPRAQAGNPRPRVFRLPAIEAVVNRMGFPNEGADAVRARMQSRRSTVVCGVNIGKNADTPLENAVADYLSALRKLHSVADYVAINISSPNTFELTRLQEAVHLRPILESLLGERERLHRETGKRVPLAVKLSPDLAGEQLEEAATIIRTLALDAVVATNSTTRHSGPDGGLSGAPLHEISLAVVRRLRSLLGARFPIIGVGGVRSPETARAMLNAGANLVQIYAGLIYEGPGLIRRVARALETHEDFAFPMREPNSNAK